MGARTSRRHVYSHDKSVEPIYPKLDKELLLNKLYSFLIVW
jgi:hypothetical protein